MRLLRRIRPRLLASKLKVLSPFVPSKRNMSRCTPRTIAFVCFYTVTPWNADSLPPGTAGAEQALTELARALACIGWTVTVFCNCGPRPGSYDGVLYTHEYKFNPLTSYDTVVIWRDSRLSRFRFNAAGAYLWMHNVPRRGTLGPSDLSGVNDVITLSDYHTQSLEEIPQDRVFTSLNGVAIAVDVKDVERRPFRFIYASSPDRGLELLLKLWPMIREYVPQAELSIYYGWETWEYFNGGSAWARRWRLETEALMSQPGIVNTFKHIPPAALQLEFAASSVWLYPTEATEVSCINAMLAQALGAIPVTTSAGALSETVRFGHVIYTQNIYTDLDAQLQFVKAAICAVLRPNEVERSEMMSWAIKRFSWIEIARSWTRHFRDHQLNEAPLASTGRASHA